MGTRAAVRLADVAKRAGVSLATASRVLSTRTSYRGRPEFRRRVLAAAAELGYEPNLHARVLAGARSPTVALVVHDIRDAYFALIAGAVVAAASHLGTLVTIVSTHRDPAQEARYLSLLRAQRPRAVILAGSGFANVSATEPITRELLRYRDEGGVVVSLGHRGVGHQIIVGNQAGARALADRMVDLGHTRFALVGGPAAMTTVRDRLRGFGQGLRDRGIRASDTAIIRTTPTREGGVSAAQRVIDSDLHPTCVFGCFDVVGVGLVSGLQQRGIDVPSDISVAGFADIPVASDITPALTTVRLPLDAIGKMAVELALGDQSDQRTITFEGEPVIRASTARPLIAVPQPSATHERSATY